MDYIAEHYLGYNEDARLTSKHGQVEYLTTMKYIHNYLRPGMTVLEVGCATGRYSHALAQEGVSVVGVELLDHHIEQFIQNTTEGEDVVVLKGNALDLGMFQDNTFDVVLLLGPMYHLYTYEDKLQALKEAFRVCRQCGYIFIAYCMSNPTLMTYGFVQNDPGHMFDKGLVDPVTFALKSDPAEVFDLVTLETINKLDEEINANRVKIVATDGYTNHMRGVVDSMDELTYNRFVQYHLATCERPDLLGYSHHTLDILCKER